MPVSIWQILEGSGQRDPLSANTLDPYGYGYNNPIFFADPTGLEGEPVLGGSGPGGPQAIGTASSPIDVGEIVLNPPIRAVSNNNLATCSYCMTGQGQNLREQLNIPGPPKVQSIEEAQRILKPVLHNGSAQMMDSMIWDLAGILIARNIKPENQNAALGLAALAIIVSKGRATPAIAKAEAAAAKAEAKVVAKRGSFRRQTLKDAWDNAKDGTKANTKACPTCNKDVEGNPYLKEKRNGPNGWDASHNPSWSNRNHSGMTRKQQLDDYNTNVDLECFGCNRAGKNNDSRFNK